MKYLVVFIATQVLFILSMYSLINEKIKLKSFNLFFSYFIALLLFILNFEFCTPSLRVVVNLLIYILLAKLLFKKGFKESTIIGMLIVILGIFSEFVYIIFTYPIFHYTTILEGENLIVAFINNLGVGLILFCICHFKKVKRLYEIMANITSKISEKKVLIFSLLIMLIFNFASLVSYLVSKEILDKYYLTLIGSFLCFLCSIFVFVYFITQNKYLNICEKYSVSLDSIREFEIMIENYRVNTHENKNQFRTIRNMSKDKKINAYIDALLEENVTDDEKVLYDTQKIPAGGLRGIIYSKLLLMQQQKIPFELVIDKKVTVAKVSKIDDYTLTAICRILGVLLDNAIEAVKKLDNKYIMVELYEEENSLVISITNNYEGYVDIDNIGHPGISEKGENHGYGLTLVQKLVKQHKKIQHSSEFFEDNFMQKIKIKV